jgi:alpha-L-arabinofuranosidase
MDRLDGRRKSSFSPFAATSRLARGVAIQVGIDSPRYDTKKRGWARMVDMAASLDEDAGTAALFLVNRSQGMTSASPWTSPPSACGPSPRR